MPITLPARQANKLADSIIAPYVEIRAWIQDEIEKHWAEVRCR